MTSTELNALDEIRQLAAKTAALARAAVALLDDVVLDDAVLEDDVLEDDAKQVRLEDLAHLVGAAAEAADETVNAGVKLEMDVRTRHARGK